MNLPLAIFCLVGGIAFVVLLKDFGKSLCERLERDDP